MTRHSPTTESEIYKNHVFTHANITMQLAVRNSFFLVIIFQVSKRMKSPTKKETLFASVFLLQKLTHFAQKVANRRNLKKRVVSLVRVCAWGRGGGVVVTFLNQGNIKIYLHLSSISKQNPVDFYTNELPVQFNARFYLKCKYPPFSEEYFFRASDDFSMKIREARGP